MPFATFFHCFLGNVAATAQTPVTPTAKKVY